MEVESVSAREELVFEINKECAFGVGTGKSAALVSKLSIARKLVSGEASAELINKSHVPSNEVGKWS